jgi:hypothetical protein
MKSVQRRKKKLEKFIEKSKDAELRITHLEVWAFLCSVALLADIDVHLLPRQISFSEI